MADKKISALSLSTTPLAGSEVLPIVQSGVTKKVSVADLTSGRFVTMDSATVGSNSSPLYGSKFRIDGRVETFGNQYNIDAGNNVPYEFVNRSSGGGFEFFVNAAGKRSVIFSSGGDVSLSDNLVIGTAGKGIDFSADPSAAGMTSELLDDYEEGTWTPTQGAGLTVVGTFSSSGSYTKIGNQVTLTGRLQGSSTVACAASSVMTGGFPYVPAAFSAGSAINSNLNGSSPLFVSTGATTSTHNAIAAAGSIFFSLTFFV